MRKLLFILSVFSLFTLPMISLAHADEGDGFTHMMGDWGFNGGMTGVGGLWSWIMALIPMTWLVVGVLVIIWLWKQINKK